MKHCPITYEDISEDEFYSQHGLKLLSPNLKNLYPLELSASEQREFGLEQVGKMSIQGIQSKFGAILKVKECKLELVDQFSHYILKPQSEHYSELPENEALTMSLASLFQLEVPVHGMVYSKDNTMTYFVKRFDRTGRSNKLSVEDFSQLTKESRDTKYNSTMEKASAVLKYCTFPKIEAVKFFKLVLFNFLTGNEDMHLKNFSLITRDQIITLSPVYDLLNTTIALKNTQEEIALPLKGKKNKLKENELLNYFPLDVLNLNERIVSEVINEIKICLPLWVELIDRSFLTASSKDEYKKILYARLNRLKITPAKTNS